MSCVTASAQSLAVESFRKLDNDLTARVTNPKLDQNGEKAALVKIVTTQTGFTFDGGIMGIVDSEQRPSEIWLYIPKGLKRVSIMHPQLGMLRDYYFPETIEAATTYELVLLSGTVTTIIETNPSVQYFVLRYTPADISVDLYIDDDNYYQGTDGYVSVPLNYGKHTYRLEAQKYNPAAGVVQIGAEKQEVTVDLQTMCGTAYISSSPENGAEVYYNGRLLGTTPLYTEELLKGDYEITLKSAYYLPRTTTISILEGEQTVESIALTPNYSNVTVLVGARDGGGTDIFVNNDYKGKDSVTVRLTPGTHIFEARKTSHRSYRTSQDIYSQQDQTVILNVPTPIYGSMEVKSSSPDAKIFIDGEPFGTTPNVINNVLSGAHKLTLEKNGYETYTEIINIIEGETQYITAQLEVKTQEAPKPAPAPSTEVRTTSTPSGSSGSSRSSYSSSSYNKSKGSSTTFGLNILTMDFGTDDLWGITLPGISLGFGGIENSVNFSFGAQYRWVTVLQTDSDSDFGEDYLYTSQVSVPVNLKILMGRRGSDTRFFLGFGANYNFNMASKIKYKYTSGKSTKSEERIDIMNDYPEFINKTSYSGVFSMGILTGSRSTFSEISLFARYDFISPYNEEFFKLNLSSYIYGQADCQLFIGFNWTLYFEL